MQTMYPLVFRPGIPARELVTALDRTLRDSTGDVMADLDARVRQWCSRVVHEVPGAVTQDEGAVGRLARAVMQPSGRTAFEEIKNIAGYLADNSAPDDDVALIWWAEQVHSISQGARTVRNLVNHRRKCVGGVLQTARDGATSSELMAAELHNGHEVLSWALKLFDIYIVESNIKRDFQNNYRSEWLGFLYDWIPELRSLESAQQLKSSRRSFMSRLSEALDEFETRSRQPLAELPTDNIASRPRRTSEPMRMQSAPVMSQSVPAASPTSSEDVVVSALPIEPTPRLVSQPLADGTALLFNSEAFGITDPGQTALILSLQLTEPTHPGDVWAEEIPGPVPQIRVFIRTHDVQRVTAIFDKARKLLSNS